jgi:hypothetical protein
MTLKATNGKSRKIFLHDYSSVRLPAFPPAHLPTCPPANLRGALKKREMIYIHLGVMKQVRKLANAMSRNPFASNGMVYSKPVSHPLFEAISCLQ